MSRYDDVIFLIKGRAGHEETELERVPSQQYVAEDLRVLVPRLVGQTEYARREKSTAPRGTPMTREEFLKLMPDGELRSFFTQLLTVAEAHSLVLAFTPTVCSLKVQHPAEGLRTIAYLCPPGLQRNKDPEVWPCLEYLYRLGMDIEPIRQRFMQVAPFRESGSYTLKLSVTRENLDEAGRVQELLLQIVSELQARWEDNTTDQ